MKIIGSTVALPTEGNTHIINITDLIADELKNTALRKGICHVFIIGSTAGLTTCEYEPGLVADIEDLFDRLVPELPEYEHNDTWGDANAHSHLRASLLKPNLSVPFENKKLILGTWQQIVLIDFDNTPRQRRFYIQFIGE